MRRSLRELLLTIGAITILLMVLAFMDVRVREQLTRTTVTHPTAEAASLVARAHRGASIVAGVAREESRTHTLLLVFSVAATVLVVFMLRT